jgi:hypothetical protein
MERERANIWHSLPAAQTPTSATVRVQPPDPKLRVRTRIEEAK